MEEAERWLRKALAFAPFERDTNYQLALCLERAGKSDEAKEFQEKVKLIEADQERLNQLFDAMLKNPRDLAPRCEAGKLLLANGQEQQGLRLLQSVLEENPSHEPAHKTLAKYYEAKGDGLRAR
jgi:Flp pilus assembly protein TadD